MLLWRILAPQILNSSTLFETQSHFLLASKYPGKAHVCLSGALLELHQGTNNEIYPKSAKGAFREEFIEHQLRERVCESSAQ
jgi:hypothetical protein